MPVILSKLKVNTMASKEKANCTSLTLPEPRGLQRQGPVATTTTTIVAALPPTVAAAAAATAPLRKVLRV